MQLESHSQSLQMAEHFLNGGMIIDINLVAKAFLQISKTILSKAVMANPFLCTPHCPLLKLQIT